MTDQLKKLKRTRAQVDDGNSKVDVVSFKRFQAGDRAKAHRDVGNFKGSAQVQRRAKGGDMFSLLTQTCKKTILPTAFLFLLQIMWAFRLGVVIWWQVYRHYWSKKGYPRKSNIEREECDVLRYTHAFVFLLICME